MYGRMNGPTDRQTDKQTDRQIDRLYTVDRLERLVRYIDRQTGR